MKQSKRIMWVVLGMGLLAGTAFAQGNAVENFFTAEFTYQDLLDSKFSIRAGAWFQSIDGDFQLEEGDTNADLESDLGLDDNDDITLRAEVQPWQKHHFRFGYNGIEFDGDTALNRPLIVDGNAYGLGDRVVTDLQMDTFEIGYRYDLWRGENFVVAPLFQINLVDFDVTVNDRNLGIQSSEDQIAPLPMIGLHGEFFPHPRFGVFADVKGFTIGDTASVADMEVGAQINVCKNFSIVGGYRYSYVEFDISDVEADITIDGPFVAGQIQF